MFVDCVFLVNDTLDGIELMRLSSLLKVHCGMLRLRYLA